MTIGTTTAEKTPSSNTVRVVVAALIMAPLSVVGTISFSAIIFSGPLAPFLSQGIAMGLVGGVVLGIAGAIGSTFRGSICQPQDVTAVILSLSAGAIATRLGTEDPTALLATVIMLIAISAALVGVAFLVLGVLRLGSLGRFIPFPVLGGFLTATGYLILIVGLEMAAGPADATGLSAELAWRCGPVLLLAVILLVVARHDSSGLGVPIVLGAGFVLFYVGLPIAGLDLSAAGEMGLLLGPFDQVSGQWPALSLDVITGADYRQILAETPALMTLVGLALVGAILNASGIEIGAGVSVDVNRELRVMGAANLLVAGGGGLVGYHVLTDTLLGRRLAGYGSRWIGLCVALACGLVLLAGADVIAIMPLGIFAAVLVYLGLDFLYEWLWVERRRMPVEDFAVVLAIVAVAATIGFLEAVGTGILASSVMFLVNYARLDVVRARFTGALRLSTTERSEAAGRFLTEDGDKTLVYELQSYLFFGTAHALFDQISRQIAARPDEDLALIVDFRRVQGLDGSAVYNLGKLDQLCRARSVRLILTGIAPTLVRTLGPSGLLDRVENCRTLDDALTVIEDDRLRVVGRSVPVEKSRFAELVEAAADVVGQAQFSRETVPVGTVIFRQGDPSDQIILLENGRLSASVKGLAGDEIRVASFQAGALIGEIGFLTDSPRTATIVAVEDSVIRSVGRAGLDRLSTEAPALASDLLREVAGQLAHRLARTTALLREVSR
jgi:SulP family sulfate permease